MATDREVWLAQTVEEPHDPDLPICDPHHHLWDRPGMRYLPPDMRRDFGGLRVVKTVFIEDSAGYGPDLMRPVRETEFVRDCTAQSELDGTPEIAAGIVGFANLNIGQAVAPVLEAHLEAGRGRFRGIRHPTVWDPVTGIPTYQDLPRGLLADAKFREGFACLRKYDLSFDAWLYFHQILELADLAKAFPDTPIVLDHIGGLLRTGPYAGRFDEVEVEWRRGIAALAKCPNVMVKLGGLGMAQYGFGWDKQEKPPTSEQLAADMAPYLRWCIEHFGVERCMYESNFPVDKVSFSYVAMWNAFKLVAQDLSATEQAFLFHDSAVRFYRLS